MWLLFIRQYIFALLLMVLLADSRGIPLTTVSCWAPPRNMRGLAHVSYMSSQAGMVRGIKALCMGGGRNFVTIW